MMRSAVWYFFLFFRIRRPPRSTRTDTLFPYTTLFRSFLSGVGGLPWKNWSNSRESPLQAVQEAASAADLLYPVDLGARGSTTIGGTIASNAGGPAKGGRLQSIGSCPFAFRKSFALLKCLHPKKPLWADSGDGCGAFSTRWRPVSTFAAFFCAWLPPRLTPDGVWRRFTPATTPTAQGPPPLRSEEHKSELQSLMRISYAVFCLKKKK